MSGEPMRDLKALLDALDLTEAPMGMLYTDSEPEEGYTPKPGRLPGIEQEARNEIDWNAIWSSFSCIMGNIWLARKKQTAAYFDREHFGCLGGAFFLGYLKPQLDFIVHYVSTGIPSVVEGECYLSSPQVTRRFYEEIDPRPAPAKFCVLKPLSQFSPGEAPELITFFARPEAICGLHQLATFVTDDFHAVLSPFGSGCANMVTWPLKGLADGELKAFLGGWDPSDRPFLKTDELTFTVPLALYDRMIEGWTSSFLTTRAWKNVRKKIARSRRAWGEEGAQGPSKDDL